MGNGAAQGYVGLVRQRGIFESRRIAFVSATVMVFLAISCAEKPASEQPVRSPTLDYPNPPAQTSDGQVVGADGQRPEDKLQTGPTNEQPAPGWSADHGAPKYDPADRVGGQTTHETKGDTDPPESDEEEPKGSE